MIAEAKKLNIPVIDYHPAEPSIIVAFILKGSSMLKIAVSSLNTDARNNTLHESLKLFETALVSAASDISVSVYCKEKIGIIYYLLSEVEKVEEKRFTLLKSSVDNFLDAGAIFSICSHLSANVIDYFIEALEQFSKSLLVTKDMEKQFALKAANRIGPSLLDTQDSFTTCTETSDDKSCSKFLSMYLQGLKESENNSTYNVHIGSIVIVKDVDHYKPHFKANETATVISIDKYN